MIVVWREVFSGLVGSSSLTTKREMLLAWKDWSEGGKTLGLLYY